MGRILLFSMMLTFGVAAAQNCPTVDDVTQTFCQSEGSGNDYYRPAVQHLSATANGDAVAWYATADSDEALNMDELLVDGNSYFAGNASGTCDSRIEVVVELADAPNAGGTTHYEVAITAEPFDILDVYNPSILVPPEAGGTVVPALSSGTTIFDPSVDGSGQYRYVVSSTNQTCPDDFSFIYVTVVPEPQNPPDDPTEENCPIVDSPVQTFCESQGTGNDFYRPSVAHLVATANGDDIVWFDTPTSTEPLAMDEILVDGEDYYAGNASGACTARVRVDCVVNTSPNAGSTTFMTFCSNAGPVDLLDYLNPSILGEADDNGQIVPPLASGSTLFDPSVDVAGRYDYHVESPNNFCADDKAVIYISVTEAATAGDDIVVNLTQNDDPIDLFAEAGATSGASASWNPPLNSGSGIFDPSVDAAGVYTLTVFNDEGCADDTAEITVNVSGQGDPEQNCPIVTAASQTFCESQGTGNDYYRPAVAHLQATANGDDIAWFDTELSADPLSADEILVDGEDYYAGNVSGTCSERQRVVVTLNDSPNAGATTSFTVRSSDEPFDLLERMNPSILGNADTGGTFDPPLASGTTIFDPSIDTGGKYTYTVLSTSDCADDSAVCYITVEQDSQETASTNPNDAVKVLMYPNPSKGAINLSMGEGVQALSLRIIDLNGNTVKRMELESTDQLQNLDISSLRPSLYFAEVVTDKGKVVKRIIKN